MAERRMFAKTIVLSDVFLDMPMSARCLYFTLGMLADDDGFINSPKSIMRQCGASEDDMKLLILKKFVLDLIDEDGVIVVKHWRVNNYLRSDRYIETKYVDAKEKLQIDDNGIYHLNQDGIPVGIPLGIPKVVSTGKDSIGKDSIGKDSIGKDSKNNTTPLRSVYYPTDDKLNDAFAHYVEHRKSIKKPFKTDYAIGLAIKNLDKLSNGDNDIAIKILEQSIMNGWQGLFALKEQGQNANNKKSERDDALDFFKAVAEGRA